MRSNPTWPGMQINTICLQMISKKCAVIMYSLDNDIGSVTVCDGSLGCEGVGKYSALTRRLGIWLL